MHSSYNKHESKLWVIYENTYLTHSKCILFVSEDLLDSFIRSFVVNQELTNCKLNA